MKKLLFVMIAFCAMSFVSCGSASKKVAPKNDTTVVADSDTVSVDSVASDSAAL